MLYPNIIFVCIYKLTNFNTIVNNLSNSLASLIYSFLIISNSFLISRYYHQCSNVLSELFITYRITSLLPPLSCTPQRLNETSFIIGRYPSERYRAFTFSTTKKRRFL